MLRFSSSLTSVPGIGPSLFQKFSANGIKTVGNLLLNLPLRYEDRSKILNVAAVRELPEKQIVSVEATVAQVSQFNRGYRKIQTATINDPTGNLKLMWFNSPFVLQSLKRNQVYVFSGSYDPKFKSISQATFEPLRSEMIHTGRIVPLYSSRLDIAQGSFRRILKKVVDEIDNSAPDPVAKIAIEGGGGSGGKNLPDLITSLGQLHFPDQPEAVDLARRRLAIEEFLSLMQQSQALKQTWQELENAPLIKSSLLEAAPKNLPFSLTAAQNRSITEILTDTSENKPMNRLLIGDVGSGKTVVAGAVAAAFLANGWSAAIIAPTKILAGQHAQSLQKMFPDLPLELIAGNQKKIDTDSKPKMFIGTHKLINQLENLRPGLIVYDEQHRFGVGHRSASLQLDYSPHILTMTATPIPRSLMLTIFAHLQVSHLDEMPPGRKTVKSWYSSRAKKVAAYHWLAEQIHQENGQAIVVCPFIDPSDHDAFDKVAAVTQVFEELSALNQTDNLKLNLGMLHGRLKPADQAEIIERLYAKKINLLVTTPIVEIGVDLPEANIIVIESAERFGLASLHQLRGRVGRAGQQAYCLLFSSTPGQAIKSRLEQFCKINNGKELAELDLKKRGSGDLFGTAQSGFDQLRFGSWADSELISLAQRIFKQLPADWQTVLPQNKPETNDVLGN